MHASKYKEVKRKQGTLLSTLIAYLPLDIPLR
jgi:hypothetical protein